MTVILLFAPSPASLPTIGAGTPIGLLLTLTSAGSAPVVTGLVDLTLRPRGANLTLSPRGIDWTLRNRPLNWTVRSRK